MESAFQPPRPTPSALGKRKLTPTMADEYPVHRQKTFRETRQARMLSNLSPLARSLLNGEVDYALVSTEGVTADIPDYSGLPITLSDPEPDTSGLPIPPSDESFDEPKYYGPSLHGHCVDVPFTGYKEDDKDFIKDDDEPSAEPGPREWGMHDCLGHPTRITGVAPPLRLEEPFLPARFSSEWKFFDSSKELGHAHILDLDYFSRTTDPSTFRACDCICTILYRFNRRLAQYFFAHNDRNGAFMRLLITDKRFHKAGLPTWILSRRENIIHIESYSASSDDESLSYQAEVVKGGRCESIPDEFRPKAAASDEEEIGAILGRSLVLEKPWDYKPYHQINIFVEAGKVHRNWPG
ncbi:hypothetical protein QBC35DRAFT_467880, partial [Podospora australis]